MIIRKGGGKRINIEFLGGCKEVGRSAVLVDDVLLDYGMKPSNPPQFPINGIRPKSIIVSHAHIDHSGTVANLMDVNPEIYMTSPTRDLAYFLGKDTIKISRSQGIMPFEDRDLRRFMEKTTAMPYNKEFYTSEYAVKLFDAGHIPGSSCIYLNGEKSVFYTGDINTRDTRLLKKADHNYPKTDVLIIESTYFGKNHPDRSELEKKFVESVSETLDCGGNVIIPCFAVGRTQEIVMILHAYGLTPYVDGMGVDVLDIFMRYPSFLRDEKKLEEAFNNVIFVNSRRRAEVVSEPSIVVTTAGMLNGGPALYYLGKKYDDPKSRVLLTGYQVEDTNGSKAINYRYVEARGRILNLKAKVEQYDFSAHTDDSGLKKIVSEFVKRGTEHVFTIHGEKTKEFAKWISDNCGCTAYAPVNGDEIIF